jgi:hypothetical protein
MSDSKNEGLVPIGVLLKSNPIFSRIDENLERKKIESIFGEVCASHEEDRILAIAYAAQLSSPSP